MLEFEVSKQPGILTESQRRYLLGQRDVEPDSERVIRSRIRNRAIEAVRDFEILAIGLSERDHKLIFEKGMGHDIGSGGSHTPRTVEDDDKQFIFVNGVQSGWSFLFEGMRMLGRDIGDMERMLELAIGDAETSGGSWVDNPDFTSVRADVSIEFEEAHSPERLYKQLHQGKRLEDEELGRLVRSGILSPSDLATIESVEERFIQNPLESREEEEANGENN